MFLIKTDYTTEFIIYAKHFHHLLDPLEGQAANVLIKKNVENW